MGLFTKAVVATATAVVTNAAVNARTNHTDKHAQAQQRNAAGALPQPSPGQRPQT